MKRGLISIGRTHDLAARIIDRFNVVAGGSRAAARSLSGGNLQKFIIGREILQNPRVLVAAQPAWVARSGTTGRGESAGGPPPLVARPPPS